jgi:hypothetical protein
VARCISDGRQAHVGQRKQREARQVQLIGDRLQIEHMVV